MPVAVGSNSENPPDFPATHMLQLGDGLFDVLAGTIRGGAHDEQLDGLVGKPLAFAHPVA